MAKFIQLVLSAGVLFNTQTEAEGSNTALHTGKLKNETTEKRKYNTLDNVFRSMVSFEKFSFNSFFL